MGENKTEQYTFGPEEKEILNILGSFENQLGENLKEIDTEIESVKYYNDFSFNGEFIEGFENIFITVEKDKNGEITYNLYNSNMKKILSMDSEGKIKESIEDFEKTLGKINIKELIEENEVEKGKLKGISENATSEEMEKALVGKEKEKEEEEKENSEDEETQEIEEDLQEQGEDLRISKYRKIKDSHISERMPEVFQDGTENGIAYSNKLNRFVIISKVNGHYQINENVEPARMTWKTIISIDPDGNKVERKVPHALMQLPNNQEKEIAVTLDEYGDADIETVNVLPCQERVARHVRSEGEGIEKEENLEMRTEFKTEGKEYEHDLAHQVKEIEQAQKDENKTVDYDITPDDYIPNTEITWNELMEETGESLPRLIERYNREMEKEGADSKEVVETIENDYGIFPNRQR